MASMRKPAEPIDVTALFDDANAVERALDALYSAGTPRDLIEVVVSREAADRYYASPTTKRAPRALGRETWRYAGAGALVGFVAGCVISLVVVAWPGLGSPGGMAPVALIGPNVGTMAGAALGALLGALRRQQPQSRHARAAEAANAVVVAVAARSEREAELLGQLLTHQGGRDVRLQIAEQ
jgi:hypothetical protein